MATIKKLNKSFNDTHRTSYRVGWPSGLGALDTNPPSLPNIYFRLTEFQSSALLMRPLDSRTKTTTSTRFDLKFFGVFSKYRHPESFLLPFFTTEVSSVTFSEGGYTIFDCKMIKFLTIENLDNLDPPLGHSR